MEGGRGMGWEGVGGGEEEGREGDESRREGGG